jgi:hypothetical protein
VRKPARMLDDFFGFHNGLSAGPMNQWPPAAVGLRTYPYQNSGENTCAAMK